VFFEPRGLKVRLVKDKELSQLFGVEVGLA